MTPHISKADLETRLISWMNGHYVTCASDIGLNAGHWPFEISTELANGRPFQYNKKRVDEEGDITMVIYLQPGSNLELKVFND